MAQKNIGDIFVAAGVINSQQLQMCQKEIAETGQTLEEYLISKKIITAEGIAKIFAKFFEIEYVAKITDQMVDVNILGRVPLRFLRENAVIPVMIDNQIIILTVNPLKFQPIDELNILLGNIIHTAVSTSKNIIDAINKYYPIEGAQQMIAELEEEEELEGTVAFEEIEEKDILGMATEAPIIKLVNHILFQAVKRGASDIHIEPFEKEVVVRYRIDGVMYQIMTPPKRVQGALSSRIKIMAGLNIAEKRIPQDGRIEIKVANKSIDIRVSALPVAFGERIAMRLLDKARTFAQLEDMGLSKRDLEILNRSITRPNGIIYMTGPTGSGKTTTLYAILTKLNKTEINIVTVEDPIEYQIQGIGQVHVKEKIGLTFAAALRSILRQDPDIIMIGETRDQETAQIAIQAALTGHLVLSTLHTNSAAATITRLLDMGIEPFLIASSVVLSCAQRLVRRLCDMCKIEYTPAKELITNVGISVSDVKTIKFYKSVGCEECNRTGFKGRIALFEIMEMSIAIAHLVMTRSDTDTIKRQAQKEGMTLLLEDGVIKIKQGLTTIEEVLSVAAAEGTIINQ